jgi:hypothetical protein
LLIPVNGYFSARKIAGFDDEKKQSISWRRMPMKLKLLLFFCTVLIPATLTAAGKSGLEGQEQGKQQTKELTGMSIVGNDEAPKSLYIVPWKSSEIGMETSLNMMLNKDAVPVDRDVFTRQLDFYEVSTANISGRK